MTPTEKWAYLTMKIGAISDGAAGVGGGANGPLRRLRGRQGAMMLLTDKEIEQLKAFYNVQTDRELIEAMDSHLTKLQSKLWAMQSDEPAIRQVRA